MTHEYLEYPVGTVFKEIYDGKTYYYILGSYFVYCNNYHNPEIRPHKIDLELFEIASDNEAQQFIKDLKANNLIWDEKTGTLEREYDEIPLSVKVKVKPGTDVNNLLEILNLNVENPLYVYNMKFENF